TTTTVDELTLAQTLIEINAAKPKAVITAATTTDVTRPKTGVRFDSQVNDKYQTGKGYHAVPPSYTGNFLPPKPDLILANVDEYVSEFVTSVPTVATNEAKTTKSKPKSISEPLIEDWVSDSAYENETDTKSKQREPIFAKVEFVKPNE
nr:hypothetical protein [Tanacetum cinerariifolium]